MNSFKTPCHQCIGYDHGTSMDPQQKCRAVDKVIGKALAERGCDAFFMRPRFALEKLKRKNVRSRG